MKISSLLMIVLIFCTKIQAFQSVHTVRLNRTDGILFSENGEISVTNDQWKQQTDYDFYFIPGRYPTICPVKEPLEIYAKSKFYIYKNKQKPFSFYNQTINLESSDFDTSISVVHSNYAEYFSFLHIENSVPQFFIFKTTLNMCALLIVDSMKIGPGCPVTIPECCRADSIEELHVTIVLQSNGLPQFPVIGTRVKKIESSRKCVLTRQHPRLIDIQGRIIDRTGYAAGLRLITTGGDILLNRYTITD
ncbi:MAG: hypothetical protein JW915_21890 [Chitinispirillaceae bacterium]|nr:hypothetical protein [Chitinispirillaceae bacterium]